MHNPVFYHRYPARPALRGTAPMGAKRLVTKPEELFPEEQTVRGAQLCQHQDGGSQDRVIWLTIM